MSTSAHDTNVFSPEVSDIYDLIYLGRGKNYADEAAVVTDLARERKPDAASLLDLACGTGEHLAWFRTRFDHVEGLDLSERMVEVARRKLPTVPIHASDIRDFDLGRTFDVVCCMYSTVGYMSSTAELDQTIACMARHLAPGGVLVVEPWWFPERFIEGYISDDVVRDDGRTVARVAWSTRVGDVAKQVAHYVVADPGGIRHFEHVQHLTLFKASEYEAAFERAGCSVEYLDRRDLLAGRGVYVAIRES